MTYWQEMNIDNSSWVQPSNEAMGMTPLEYINFTLSDYKSEGITDFGLAYGWDTANNRWEVYVLF